MQRYWLVKSEPEAFGWQDLHRAAKQTTCWDGVRNYQARNTLRDEMQLGDQVFFYQSCTKPLGIVGTLQVVRAGYPDPTQFQAKHPGFDGNSRPDAPRWYAVDLQLRHKFSRVLELETLRSQAALQQMVLLRKGSRLSVQPVEAEAWRIILRLAKAA